MILLIIGLILAVVGRTLKNKNEDLSSAGNGLFWGGLVLGLFGLLWSSVKQIDAGKIGVQSLFGKVQSQVLPSGLNLINPLMDVLELDIKTQNYTMSGVHDEGNKDGDDAIRVLTADGLEVTIDLTVLYSLIPSEAPRLVRETGVDYQNKI
ncbi:MAG: prohibitin family protein, partial [Chitinophagaceae bacterium]|nr:prohibitin family protein [Chitinophagaceae bacterium]